MIRGKKIYWMLLPLLLLGCGGSGGKETAEVRGTVTLDGMPYTQGGTITFRPEGGGKMATGYIESDGTYALTTYSAGDGAVLGRHQVMFLALPSQGEDESAEVAQASRPPNRKSVRLSESPLICEVQADAENEFLVELKSQ